MRIVICAYETSGVEFCLIYYSRARLDGTNIGERQKEHDNRGVGGAYYLLLPTSNCRLSIGP